MSGAVPLAVTLKVTLLPARMVAPTGNAVMAGGIATVNVAAGLMTPPRQGHSGLDGAGGKC